MPVEIEAKIKVSDHAALRVKLKSLGAVAHGLTKELNTFFDTEDRSLLASDKGLRVRHQQHLESGKVETILTFKGPRQHGQFKSREEIEVNVSDADDMTAVLHALGYKTVLSFEKLRESWSLDGCKVELDELPRLGTYIEIEGPGDEAVMRVRNQLGLSDQPQVKASYIALLITDLQEHAVPGHIVRFEDQDGH